MGRARALRRAKLVSCGLVSAIVIAGVIPPDVVAQIRARMEKGPLVSGKITAVGRAQTIKDNLILSPNGKQLYLTTGPGKSVQIVDVAKKAPAGTIEGVGGFPRGIAVSPDGKKLYTANAASNDVAIIDVASKKVQARVAVPGAPWSVVFVP